jgi:hypothetical protein
MLGPLFNKLLSLLYNWRTYDPKQTIKPDEDWIVIKPERNIFVEQKNQINKELNALNSKSFTVVARNQINETIKRELAFYDSDTLEILQQISVTSDIRMKIFKDTLTKISPEWLQKINCAEIERQWYPNTYQHNILGELITLATMTSPERFTVKGISQSLVVIHLSLLQSLNENRVFDETRHELHFLIQTAIPQILRLWIDTVKKIKICKIGILASKWKLEEKEKEILLQSSNVKLEKETNGLDKDEFQKRKLLLQSSLKLKL